MKVNGKHFHTIWLKPDQPHIVQVIDQRFLPHQFIIEDVRTLSDAVKVIKEMHVRGAGLIGITAGFGMYLAALEVADQPSNFFDEHLQHAAHLLIASRPTAVNLAWAVHRQMAGILGMIPNELKIQKLLDTAKVILQEDIQACQKIGNYGFEIIQKIYAQKKPGEPIHILTHCNAGWLAFGDYGSATAPIYKAFDSGINVHVWVDETRPQNQGARLTAWELGQHEVPHTVIADNTGGHLMQHGLVDMVITGADRVSGNGDVANKIGTYLKALAAYDNRIPFYVAFPSSTFDASITDGVKQIPIEERNGDEVRYMQGLYEGKVVQVLSTPQKSKARNDAFDVTPSRLVTGYITEKGILTKKSLCTLTPTFLPS